MEPSLRRFGRENHTILSVSATSESSEHWTRSCEGYVPRTTAQMSQDSGATREGVLSEGIEMLARAGRWSWPGAGSIMKDSESESDQTVFVSIRGGQSGRNSVETRSKLTSKLTPVSTQNRCLALTDPKLVQPVNRFWVRFWAI